MKKALCAALMALLCLCLLPPGALAADVSVAISPDGTTASVTGDASGLYVRASVVIEHNGETGLFITQAEIGDGGIIAIPDYRMPGLTVRGISIALVRSVRDITSAAPDPVAHASRIDGQNLPGGPEPADAHLLTLEAGEGGTIPAGLAEQISGYYEAGAQISVIARGMPGFRFVRWETSGGGSFADENSSQTTFTMPGEDTVVTAIFAAL